MVVQERRPIDLEEGWAFIQKGITKRRNILEGKHEKQFSSEDYMMLYTTIYNMCTQKAPHDYLQHLYDKYRESFEEYITSTVLPSLREKHDELMLRELVLRWSNHKIMVQWLSRFLHYVDRFFVSRNSLTPLKEVGLTCFRDLVYQEIKGQVKDAVIALIDKEREGEQIDRALLKNVLDIFVEIGLGQIECYENDFEVFLLKGTTEYYSVKARSWFTEYSCPRYMNKAQKCLKREKERVGHYLHYSSEQKLLRKVLNELLARYNATVLKEERSGCSALLHDEKVEDLSRKYQSPVIPNGLEPISASNKVAPEIVMQRVCEGIKGSGSVVLVMFARKDKSAVEEYRSLINKSASLDVKRQWKNNEIHTTGFVVGEDPTCVFILTCAHSVEEVFNKCYPIEAKTIENLYKISVTCDHLEREHRRKEDSEPSNRVFVPAQVMEVNCQKDLLLIKVQKGICGENHEPHHEPLELAQNLPVNLERVGMVSWPYPQHEFETTGHISHQGIKYSDLYGIFSDAYGYDFTALQVDIGCPPGSSGAPLVDLAGKVIGLVHGGNDRFNYFVPLKDIRAFLTHCGVIKEDGSTAVAAAT